MKTIWTTHPSHSVCHLPSQGKAFLYGILPLIRGLYPRVILSAVELRSSAEGGISRGFCAYLSQDPFVTSFLGFARILAKLRLRASPSAQDDTKIVAFGQRRISFYSPLAPSNKTLMLDYAFCFFSSFKDLSTAL